MDSCAQDLLANLDRVHTTDLGMQRIRKNLSLSDEDAVEFCIQKILKSKNIVRQGKNYYVIADGAEITVNARSYTIITAHPV